MANKIKRISINALENATKENYSSTVTIEWNGLPIVIKRNLNLAEMMAFVDSVTNSCFSDEDGTYKPELKDYAIRSMAVELYTNISTPSDIYKKYDLLYISDIWDVVLANINEEQFSQMIYAIDDKIENIAASNISVINKQVTELYGAIEQIQKQIQSMFDGVNSEDIKNVIGAIADGGIDEEKLIKAYMANK